MEELVHHAFIRMEKKKSWSAIRYAQNHCMRKSEYIEPTHPENTEKNTFYIRDNETSNRFIRATKENGMQLDKEVQKLYEKRIKRKIRKDAVLMGEVVTMPTNFNLEEFDESYRRRYFRTALNFLESYFGKGSVQAVSEHYDELHYHIHFFVTPLVQKSEDEYGLSWDKYCGGKQKLSKFQDLFYEAMSKEFPTLFERGSRFLDHPEIPTRKHVDHKKWKRDIIIKAAEQEQRQNEEWRIDIANEILK